MTPVIVETKLEVSEAVDCRLPGNGADDSTDLVLQRDVFVAGSLRHEARALQVERPKLVGHDRLIRILERLGRQTNG